MLFDIDGTLLASGGAGRAAMEEALLQVFGLERLRGRVEFSGRTDRAISSDLLQLHEVEVTPANLQRFLSTYLQLLPGHLAQNQGQVLPGILALLQVLGQRDDAILGLLTGNIREGARRKLHHYGLAHHFRFGGYGDHHLDRCDVAREALAELHRHIDGSVPNDRVWVIGDTPLDVRCARAIGAQAVAVATGWHSMEELAAEKPDYLLKDLSDPALLLRSWTSS